MKRTFLGIILLLAIPLLSTSSETALNDSSGHVYIIPDERIVSVNDTFSLFIQIDTVRQLKSFLFDIEVDTAVIQLLTASREPFFNGPSGAFFFWKDTTHILMGTDTTYLYEILSSLFGHGVSVDGPGRLVKLHFKAMKQGYSPVWFRVVDLLDAANTEIVLDDSLHGLVIVCPTDFVYGDADFNGIISVSDAVYLINYIFASGPKPQPIKLVGDADCSGLVTVSDAVYIINYIFGGGPSPCSPCL